MGKKTNNKFHIFVKNPKISKEILNNPNYQNMLKLLKVKKNIF